eukprot:8122155-Alexandrium_andersonii.AAC.1
MACDFCVVSAKAEVSTISAGEGRGLWGQRYAFIIMDLGTGLVGFYPTSARGATECRNSLDHVAGDSPTRDLYCDGAKEFRNAMHDMITPGDYSVPGRRETN